MEVLFLKDFKVKLFLIIINLNFTMTLQITNSKTSNQNFKLQLLLGLYVMAMLTANFIGNKIWEITYPEWLQNLLSFLDIFSFNFGQQLIIPFSSQSLSFSVGLFALPITFLITDIIVETMGKQEADKVFFVGLICLTIALSLTALAVNLPSAIRWDTAAFKGASFSKPEAYNYIFGSSIRFMIASLVAFAVAQFLDIFIFNQLKQKSGEPKLWLRNNLSTIFSQFIDTAVFYIIAFTKLPFAIPFLAIEANSGLDFDFMLKIFIPYYLFKVFFAILDTPLVYLGVWWVRPSSK